MCVNDLSSTSSTNKSTTLVVATNFAPQIRLRRRLPPILPNTDYKTRLRLSFEEILNEKNTRVGSYSANIIKKMENIGKKLTDEQVFALFQHLLANTKQVSTQCQHAKTFGDYYWWSTYFQCLQYIPDDFYNRYLDITASTLLKCYEFLTLKSSDSEITRLQALLETTVTQIIMMISTDNYPKLVDEILLSNLPCSQFHQYEPSSLNYYILRNLK